MPDLLFAYGTLTPTDPEAALRDGWTADLVRGRLYDLGAYPALVDVNDPKAGWVEGYVRAVGPRELIERLDPYEQVEEGLYRRVETTTLEGRQVWVYVYARPLPPHARGPFPRWDGLIHVNRSQREGCADRAGTISDLSSLKVPTDAKLARSDPRA